MSQIDLLPRTELDIHCQDFQDFLKNIQSESVDLVLTDPPYAISRKTNFHTIKTWSRNSPFSMDFGEWDHKEIDLDKLVKESHRVLRQGGTAIIWYSYWNITTLYETMKQYDFKVIRLIVWRKTNPPPINGHISYLTNAMEIAVKAVKNGSKGTFHGMYHNGQYDYPVPGKGRIHPTQKPVELFDDLILRHSNKDDLVIDPFLGSGTTAVAALRNGRRFRGCDISEDYINAIKNRIK